MSAPATTASPAASRGWKLERVSKPSLAAQVLVPVASIFAALVVGSLIIWSAGENPFTVYKEMFTGAFARFVR